MAQKTKKFKIKFKEETTVVLNGETISFEQWLEDYIKPFLTSFGADSVEEES